MNELSDEEALAFHRHCVELELEQATKPPVDSKSMKAMCLEGVSPFVLAHQHRVSMYDPDKRNAAKLSHDTVILRSGLALGLIDPFTGRLR
jgi:hypothetical protein